MATCYVLNGVMGWDSQAQISVLWSADLGTEARSSAFLSGLLNGQCRTEYRKEID